MATEFSERVIKTILKIPKGQVATYGQIAALSGKPGAARGVSWILHSSSKSKSLPWQRVVSSKGRISFPRGSRQFDEQLRLLKKERITLDERGLIELTKFQWAKNPAAETRPRGRTR